MGKWHLESVNGMHSPLDTAAHYGNNFHVYFRLRYTPSLLGSFTEPPRLDWHEKILMKEHHLNQWWEFETNMYTLKPASNTVGIWMARYYEAYNHAANLPKESIQMKGSSKLFDRNGAPVTVQRLGANLTNRKEKADAVRSYLKKHGGILVIEVHDIPSLALPMEPGKHKERLLLFDCGLEGGGIRLKAEQYLNANQAVPRTNWQRQFNMSWTKTFTSGTLMKVPTPPGVASPSNYSPMNALGEYW